MYRAAMQSMVSQLVREDRLFAVESLEVAAPRTKLLTAKLAEFGLTRALILVEAYEEKLFLAARNIPYVDVMPVASLDPLTLIQARQGDRHGGRLETARTASRRRE